uniref:Chloride channel K n=1 Tax=Fundulus heteroclitus TaxID=8078 RepID=A0A3Q2T9D7_FUNHE
MKSFNESSVIETNAEDDLQKYETNSKASLNMIPLLLDSWKPCRGPRANVKELLLKLRECLGSICGIQWYGFAMLGVLTAILSFLMDLSVAKLLRAHQWLYGKLEGHILLQFLCWTLYPACLCAFASTFSHNICPFSTGSGIPEVRTMLAGFEMPHYISLTNMFAKVLGLTCTLAAGSTVFLGKVEEAGTEMLVVAAAVGVASCFGAPISGVLFSVEVMSSHFALRHYCPCFFSAACGALTFHLLFVWSGDGETLQALFKTNFSNALPFYPLEILVFAFLGLLCGLLSCCYLFGHRWILKFTKTNRVCLKMLTTEKGLYSGLVVFFLASLTFPLSAGQYMASKHTTKQLLTSLLDSRQWSAQSHNASVQQERESLEWSSSGNSIFLSLAFFLLMKLWMLVLACTLPLPAGYFMPVFVLGAAMGRLLGEGVAYMSSGGEILGQQWTSVNPGGYALAGAAAFSGAVTHTLSPALLAIELTGQFSHAVPILLSTLVANAVARSGDRPSFYDALSISKKLPHLPSLKKACPQLPSTPLGQVLGANSVQLQKTAGPAEVQAAVSSSSEAQIPVVDSNDGRRCILHTQIQYKPRESVAYGILSVAGAQTLFVAESGKLVGQITRSEVLPVESNMCGFLLFHTKSPCMDPETLISRMHVAG